MRTPKKRTPLRQVREATGLDQTQFMAFIGYERGYQMYSKIERGVNPVTPQLARRVADATGVRLDTLTGESPIAIGGFGDFLDKPYTAETFKAWPQYIKKFKKGMTPKALSESFASWLEVLLIAAEEKGLSDNAFLYMQDNLMQCVKAFNLSSEVMVEMDRRKVSIALPGTAGYFRKHHPEVKVPKTYADDFQMTARVMFPVWFLPSFQSAPPRTS